MAESEKRTPLSWAAGEGHDEVVKLLLTCQKVNPNLTDEVGRTPLLWAAERCHFGVVQLLLGCEDVNPNVLDNIG